VLEEEQNPQSLPETSWEIILRCHWVCLGLIAALGAGGNIDWARGALGAFGMLGPILVAAYHYSTERRPEPIVTPYLALMFPWWVVIAIFLASIIHPAFVLQEFDGQKYWEMLTPAASWLPVSGLLDVSFLEVVFVCGLYAATVNAYLIPQNRLTFARTWVILSIIAGLMAVLGIAQYFTGADRILWSVPFHANRFFATFPHYSQWCAFAILWMGVAFGLVAWLVRQRSWRWLGAEGWCLLFLGLALGVSVALAGDPFHWLLAGAVAAVGAFSIGWQTLPRRHSGVPSLRGSVACFSVSAFVLAAAVFAGLLHSGAWIAYHGNRPDADLHSRVMADTLALWQARPLFGWGSASYGIIYTFFQQADQGGAYWAFARSDLLQSLAENGLVGTLAWWFPALWVLWRVVRSGRLASFLFAPLAALAALLVLAIPDFPLACPAVFFGFWFVLFSLGRWNEVDGEDNDSPLRRRLHKPDPTG
jgi:hypothetical protein